ncbi:hypothetical protein DL767_006344 [Monosporascus sp. MG133]|nr:hypothetical protein DL767_006344 [Monosporascus sp. MG133]
MYLVGIGAIWVDVYSVTYRGTRLPIDLPGVGRNMSVRPVAANSMAEMNACGLRVLARKIRSKVSGCNPREGRPNNRICMYVDIPPGAANVPPKPPPQSLLASHAARAAADRLATHPAAATAPSDVYDIERENTGMYLNLLPLRFRFNRSQQFQEALTDTRRKVYGTVANSGHETRINVIVQKQFYSTDDATVLLDKYFELLAYFSRDPSASLGSVPFPETDANSEKMHRAWPSSIDIMAKRFPDATAINDTQGNSWTHTELLGRANAIASALIRADVAPKVMVDVFQERTPDWVACMLAIMRIGAVYVLSDVNTMVSRLMAMVADCQSTAIAVDHATTTEAATLGPRYEGCIINVGIIPAPVKETFLVQAKAADPFIVSYTSGATGTPKGHSALGIELGFEQCLLALAFGGTLVIVPRRLRGDPAGISKLIAQESSRIPGPRRLNIPAGYNFANLSLPELQLWNAYGPSEATVGTTDTVLSPGKPVPDHVPVGSAMANRSVPVLNVIRSQSLLAQLARAVSAALE